jgi:HAD superfamily hydrolase (TIGR01509 family)
MTSKRGRIRGVIFDVDGVLCDSEPFIRAAAVQMFARQHGVAVTPEDFLPFTGAGEDRFIGGVAEKYGVTLDLPRDKSATYALYLDAIRGRLAPLPGAPSFIAACRAQGLKLAVATSADRIKLEGNLTQIGLPAAGFDAVVTGSDVTRKKPDPEVFLQAAAGLGLAPAHCLVIEDAPHGIAAGRAAGAWCLALTTSFPAPQLRQAGADWTAPDLAHVPPQVTRRLRTGPGVP